MQNHKEIIDWYINREVVACEKSYIHKKIFLQTLLDTPEKEVAAISLALPQLIIDSSYDLQEVPMINQKTFAVELVTACRQYFLGTPD